MAKESKLTQDIKARYLEEYPEGDFTRIVEIIQNSDVCKNDPRKSYLRLHKMEEIVFILFCATLCGCLSFYEIADFGRYELDWLRKYFTYQQGTPSHDTIRRVVNMIKPSELMALLLSLLDGLKDRPFEKTEKEQLAFDGKSVRGYYKSINNRLLHSVSAYATEKGLSLAQVVTHNEQGKEEGELQAAEKLVELLDLSDKVITGDAGFCNRKLAENLVNHGADYVLQLKRNQPNMYKAVEEAFEKCTPVSTHIDESSGHGRIEKRVCQTLCGADCVGVPLFTGQKSIVRVTSYRQEKDKSMTCEYRYHISSIDESEAQIFSKLIRNHWLIENSLHYVLDVTFNEDASRLRNITGVENFILFRRAVLSLLNQVKGTDTVPQMIRRSGFSREYRDAVLARLL